MKVTYDKQYRPWAACADEDDTRSVLKGVLVDPAGWLVSANGFMLLVIRATLEDVPEGFSGCLISKGFLQQAQKTMPAGQRAVMFSVDATQVTALTRYGTLSTTTMVEPAFPNWRALVPKEPEPSVSHIAIDGYYLQKAMEGFGEKYLVSAGETSTSAMLVRPMGDSTGDCFAVIMPIFTGDRTFPAKEEAMTQTGGE
jgi:hypothetical protein